MYFTLYNFFFFTIIRPIGEWIIHYLLHKMNQNHIEHHKYIYTTNDFSYFYNIKREIYLLPICVVLYILNFTNLFISLFYYLVINTMVHINPTLIPVLFNHHMIHYKTIDVNYGVTTRWVDILFGTYKSECR